MSKKGSNCVVSGRAGNKPCQKRYNAERHDVRNALKRAERHKRRLAYFAARRAGGKRNAYTEARKGRNHAGLRPA